MCSPIVQDSRMRSMQYAEYEDGACSSAQFFTDSSLSSGSLCAASMPSPMASHLYCTDDQDDLTDDSDFGSWSWNVPPKRRGPLVRILLFEFAFVQFQHNVLQHGIFIYRFNFDQSLRNRHSSGHYPMYRSDSNHMYIVNRYSFHFVHTSLDVALRPSEMWQRLDLLLRRKLFRWIVLAVNLQFSLCLMLDIWQSNCTLAWPMNFFSKTRL